MIVKKLRRLCSKCNRKFIPTGRYAKYCGSAGHVSQESVKRYIQEQEGKKVFEYDIYECPEEFKGQLKIGDYI